MWWPYQVKRPYVPLPYLHVYLDLGWVGIQTQLAYKAYEKDTFEYVSISWRLFKWRGTFSLYRPGYR